MMARTWRGVVVIAMLCVAGTVVRAQDRGSGGTDDRRALFERSTAVTVQHESQEGLDTQPPVLAPLPAPVWEATGGLTGLFLLAAWRRHRRRAEG